MKLQSIKKAFTLIELLVVITIIGILATGATSVYTSQIQKARDSTRITDIKKLQSAVEQVYQDNSEYPHSNTFSGWTAGVDTWVSMYLDRIPTDPKNNQPCNGQTVCTYIYWVSSDNNSITFWEYELSTWFEAEINRLKRANGDFWNDPLRFETWVDIWDDTDHVTKKDVSAAITHRGCTKIEDGSAPGATDSIFVSWDWC